MTKTIYTLKNEDMYAIYINRYNIHRDETAEEKDDND